MYLTDFATFFKPVYLPEDDPSQFSFYFDTSQRRSCYVAPERFLAQGEYEGKPELTQAMDLFSLGCVIAELFLEGTSIFTLAQLFKYKKGEYFPPLESIDDVNIRSLVSSMIALDTSQRLSAAEYLDQYTGKGFPEYFKFLHSYIQKVAKPLKNTEKMSEKKFEPDRRIRALWNDYELISKNLGFDYSADSEVSEADQSHAIPVILDIPGISHWIPKLKKVRPAIFGDGALMILNVVTSALRSTTRSTTRLLACDLILALGERIHDEAKLDRCLPYLMGLLDDASDVVQCAAVLSITQLLTLVSSITALQENIIPEYVLPRFLSLLLKSSPLVRATYASCLPTLAQTASRFLDMGQLLHASGIANGVDMETENARDEQFYAITAFDVLRQELLRDIETQAHTILADDDREVKRALLRCVAPLCFFFGRQKTNDIILSHAITFLNDRDPLLRLALFDSMVGIAPYIGTVGLTEYVIPLMIQALNDPEEFVVERVVQSFAAFSDMGLLSLSTLWDILRMCAKFIIHPNSWVRISTIGLFSSAARWMSVAHLNCILLPIMRPFLECDIVDFSESNIMENSKEPLSRAIYNLTLTWATKAQKSLFWKDPQRSQRSKYASPKGTSHGKIGLSSEDESWLTRLKEVGLKESQLWMVTCYKDYIYSVASLRNSVAKYTAVDNSGATFLDMQSVGALPQTVFFDYQKARESETNANLQQTKESPDMSDSIRRPVIVENPLSSDIKSSLATEQSESNEGSLVKDSEGKSAEWPGAKSDNPYQERLDMIKNKYSSYTGNNPYFLKLLSTIYNDPFTRQPLSFGPRYDMVTAPNDTWKDVAVKRRRGKPLGLLVSSFDEHQGAINDIKVAPDNCFFVTGSDDGLIKVWDSLRLEKNVINNSVQSFSCGSPVKSLCFIDGTYTMAVASVDGWVRFIKVEFSSRTHKYRRLQLIDQFKLPNDEVPVSLEPLSTNSSSLLLISTLCNTIHSFDLSSMSIAQTMKNPDSHGIITCMVADKQCNWIVVGTSRGVLDLWDVRFGIKIRSWGISGGDKPIQSLCLHPLKSKCICVSGGVSQVNDVTVWDLETLECKEVYRGSEDQKSTVYNPVDIDRLNSDSEDFFLSKLSLNNMSLDALASSVPQTLAIASGRGFDQGDAYRSASRYGYILTAGQDLKVRFWDTHSPENSVCVSGLKGESERAIYSISGGATRVVTEKTASVKGGKFRGERPPRALLIAGEQADLGRNHHSTITSLGILHRPYDMILSGDREGCLKIYM